MAIYHFQAKIIGRSQGRSAVAAAPTVRPASFMTSARARASIEAGAAFRAIAERVGYQELSGIRRQCEAWQRNASYDFARGARIARLIVTRLMAQSISVRTGMRQRRTDQRLGRVPRRPRGGKSYADSGPYPRRRARVKFAGAGDPQGTRRTRQGSPRRGCASWQPMTAPSALEGGERYFAQGERVMFLKNDRDLGVKNGSLGTVAEVSTNSMRVVLDSADGARSASPSRIMRRSIMAIPRPCIRPRAPRSIKPSCWPPPAWTAIWPTSA